MYHSCIEFVRLIWGNILPGVVPSEIEMGKNAKICRVNNASDYQAIELTEY